MDRFEELLVDKFSPEIVMDFIDVFVEYLIFLLGDRLFEGHVLVHVFG